MHGADGESRTCKEGDYKNQSWWRRLNEGLEQDQTSSEESRRYSLEDSSETGSMLAPTNAELALIWKNLILRKRFERRRGTKRMEMFDWYHYDIVGWFD